MTKVLRAQPPASEGSAQRRQTYDRSLQQRLVQQRLRLGAARLLAPMWPRVVHATSTSLAEEHLEKCKSMRLLNGHARQAVCAGRADTADKPLGRDTAKPAQPTPRQCEPGESSILYCIYPHLHPT